MVRKSFRRYLQGAIALAMLATPALAAGNKGKCVDLEHQACFTSDTCMGAKCGLDGQQCQKRGRAGDCEVVIQRPFNCCCACVPVGPDFAALSGVGASVLGAVLLGVGLMVQRRSA